jgi:hypothetical protein
MSVIPVSPDLIEVTTLLLQPSQSFSSSSSGLTGSIRLASKPTQSILALDPYKSGSIFVETSGVTSDSDLLYSASQAYIAGVQDISGLISSYLTQVSDSAVERTQFLTTSPTRFTSSNFVLEPSFNITTGEAKVPVDYNEWTNLQRRTLRSVLIPSQIVENPLSSYGYVNYHSLNFLSSNNFSTGSGIIYPNFPNALGNRDYTPDNDFTIDFFIKPKAQLETSGIYNPGTIFHLSSSICVSLISGSELGIDQKPESFRILLQLSRSADIAPSLINPTLLPLSAPNDLIFTSDDILKRDSWHRVTIRWGSSTRSYGSGSIKVDDASYSFSANYASISTKVSNDALVIGNYYDSGDRIAKFFNSLASVEYGTEQDPIFGTADPNNYKFAHQLNAELHHLSLFKRYLGDQELLKINDLYPSSSDTRGPSFFVAPFFTSSVDLYKTYDTPTIRSLRTTDSPFSYQLSAGYNAYYLNLQNFTIDFSKKKQPRLNGMSEGSTITTPFDSRYDSVDNLLMSQSINRRRNFSILPCDDGNFSPDFSVIKDDTRFQIVAGRKDSMFLSLESLVPSGTYIPGAEFSDFSYDGTDWPYLPLYQDKNYLSRTTTRVDNSSNRVTIFSIPNAYFLNRIVPGSFVITDPNVSGSGGLSFTLKDDGRGNLYRADAKTGHAKWNRVGAIFYPQGIVSILSPHLPYFGKNAFEMTFRGEVRKSVANYTVPATAGSVNTSYNPTYKQFPPTQLRSEQADDFVYITGINLHDENLNVIMRAKLAQAVQKREGDEIVFRLRYDF